MQRIINYEADWLASETIFYNTFTNKVSKNINDIIDFNYFDWDADGLCNYLDFGYSVFGQTPLKGIKFLQPNSTLSLDSSNKIGTHLNSNLEDELLQSMGSSTSPKEIMDLLLNTVQTWEGNCEGKITLPLGGGFDSRLLLSAIKNKERLNCFTYGLSDNQSLSFEVVYAKCLTEKYGVKWNQIELGNHFNYFDRWYDKFGISTHAHGMYHIEFYTKIRQLGIDGGSLLSGLIGDAWAGSVKINEINSPAEVKKLGYSHGLNVDSSLCKVQNKENKIITEFYEEKKERLNDPKYRIIESMRAKMILLKYLLQIPETFGYKTYAPYIVQDLCIGMLNLPDEEREDRKWQRDYFNEKGLYIEDLGLTVSRLNDLNINGMLNVPLTPLSEDLLGEIIDVRFIRWVNRNILTSVRSKALFYAKKYLPQKQIISRLMPKIEYLKAFRSYLVLYPLQRIITDRNNYLKGN